MAFLSVVSSGFHAKPVSKSTELIVALIGCALALLWFYHSHLFYGELKFTQNFTDPLIQAARLEHWYSVFRGREGWRDPIFFYPFPHALGMNDAYFGYGVIYSIFRSFGLDQLVSTELVSAVLRAIGFCATWLLLRKIFATGVTAALLGSILATISNGIYLGTQHTQLATIGLTPLLLLLIALFFRQLDESRWTAAALTGALTALLLSVWIMTAFYTAFMTMIFLLTGSIVAAVAVRPLLWRWLRLLCARRALVAMIPGGCLLLVGHPIRPHLLSYRKGDGYAPLGGRGKLRTAPR